MKKILGLFVIFVLVRFSAAYAADDFYYRLNFDAMNTGNFSAEGWNAVGAAVETFGSENVLTLDADAAAVFIPEKSVSEDTVVYKVKIMPCTDNGYFGVLYIANSASRTCFSFACNRQSEFTVYTGGGWKSLGKYECGRWYDIKIILNFEKQYFSIYIDGVRVIDNAAFRSSNAEIGQMKIYTEGVSAYLKDICLYRKTVCGMGIEQSLLYGGEEIPYGRNCFYVDFYKAMNPETLNCNTVRMYDAVSGDEIEYTGVYKADMRRFIITPNKRLPKGAAVRIVVTDAVSSADNSVSRGSSAIIELNVQEQSLKVDELRTEDGKISFWVQNMSMINQRQSVVIAGYNGVEMTGCRLFELSEQPFASAYFETEIPVFDNAQQITVYVFDMYEMLPICGKISVGSE